jgi:hypothetical protein
MSNFSDVFGGIKTVLEANVTSTTPALKVMEHMTDQVSYFPTAVIIPEEFDPTIFFGGNSFQGTMRIMVLLSSGEASAGFTQLYDMIDPTESGKSIIKALKDNPTLSSKVDDSLVRSVESIGRRQIFGGGDYFGFDVLLDFMKTVA